MIILYNYKDVKSYLNAIDKYRYGVNFFRLECPDCGCILAYWGSYEVNYIDEEKELRIPVLRGICRQCRSTHSIKPCFLPGKHQYALKNREAAVDAYNKSGLGLKKSMQAVFKAKQVSIMNLKYWLRTTTEKSEKLVDKILASIQKNFIKEDVVSNYIRNLKTHDILQSVCNICRWYIRLFTGKEPDKNTDTQFSIINQASNEECTGLYL